MMDLYQSNIVSCILKLSSLFFVKHGSLVHISTSVHFQDQDHWNNDSLDSMVNTLAFQLDGEKLISRPNILEPNSELAKFREMYLLYKKISANVVLFHDIEKSIYFLSNQMDNLKSQWTWNPRGYYVVILNYSNKTKQYYEAQVEFVLNELWRYKVVRAIVLTPSSRGVNVHAGRIFNPTVNCGQWVSNISIVDEWTPTMGFVNRAASLFEPYLPQNLFGCPLVVATYHLPPYSMRCANMKNAFCGGLEDNLVSAFAHKHNVTISWLNTAKFTKPWFSVIEQVAQGKADLTYGCIFWAMDSHRVDKTSVVLSASIRWYVPLNNQYKAILLSSLSPGLILVSVIFCVISILFCIFANKNSATEHKYFTSLFSCMLYVYAIKVGMNGGMFPPRSRMLKAIFICWTIFSFIHNVFFTTQLISMIAQPEPEQQISTLAELKGTNLMPYAPDTLHNIIDKIDVQDGNLAHLDKVEYHNNTRDALRNMVHHRNISVLENDKEIDFLEGYGNRHFHSIPEQVMTIQISMGMVKGSILLDKFNRMISHVAQSGLVKKWMRDIKRATHYRMNQSDLRMDVDHRQNRTEGKLQNLNSFAFKILVGGLSLSSIIFTIEIFGHRYLNWLLNLISYDNGKSC